MITAYELPETAELDGDIEEGDMVRVSESAFADAGLDDVEMSEDTDGEYDYKRIGFVFDKNTEDFSWENEAGDGSITVEVGDDPVYVVGMAATEGGAHPFYAEDLEPADRDEVLGDLDVDADPEQVDEEMSARDPLPAGGAVAYDAAELEEVGEVTPVSKNDMGRPPWPDSWKESDKPARLIAMDAWASMDASFTGCTRSMKKSMANPNRFCAAFKDHLYMTTYWR